MAQQRAASRSGGAKTKKPAGAGGSSGKSKAEQAISKTDQELRFERRNSLAARLVASILLVFLSLFLILNMFGVHAVVLDGLGNLFRGLMGYGFWILPFGLLYMAWMLFFLHEEPVKGRMLSTLALMLVLSALLHTIVCKTTFPGGISLVKSLWTSGIENASGGVLAGLIAQLLMSLISKAGTIPVLIVLTGVLIFAMFRLSAARMIHNRAEKRREMLQEIQDGQEEMPAEEPVQYDTRADLRMLATPVVRPRTQSERSPRQMSFDLPIGGKKKGKAADSDKTGLDGIFDETSALSDEEVLFSGTRKKARKRSRQQDLLSELSDDTFDVSFGGESEEYEEHNSLSYTAQVQELARESEQRKTKAAQKPQSAQDSAFLWEDPLESRQNAMPLWTDAAASGQPASKPAAIPEEELEVTKEKKLTHGEAEVAAAEVASEIEAKTDAEAVEKPAYQYPPMTMLAEAMDSRKDNTEEMRTNVRRLEETLESFGVDTKISNVVRGPAVTRYETELKPGVKMSKITSLHEDIALSLGVTSVHVAAVPGKSSTIGIEVPNNIVTSVPIKEVLESREFRTHKSALAFAAGKDVSGNYIIGDIAKMPHLLIAGTTGSGKSVCMNSIIVSLLYRDSPDECRLIMIDPKVVELSVYNGIPHLLIPVVTDPKKAAGALQWAVTEMDRRYNRFESAKVRDLTGYNKKAAVDPDLETMPRIVIIIDELADLMMVAAKEVENSIARLAAKARAAGMHLVIATQRPSADVITGVIKANIPARIAFAVASAMESNIIMGSRGAEKLLGKGDMFYAPQGSKPRRVQGCFISDEEVEAVTEFVKSSSDSDYDDNIISEIDQAADAGAIQSASDDQMSAMDDGDPQLVDAVEVVLDTKQASVSMLQRRLKLGYSHAARIMDEMEEKGIVGPFEGSKPRQLLITREQWDTMVGVNPKAVAISTDPEPTDEDDVPFDEEELL